MGSPSLTARPTTQHRTMCLSRATDKINYQETEGIVEEIAGSDHPGTEQFNMLLNLLPAHTLQQVRDMDSLSIDEADILMAAVNYILSLTSQLQHKLRWGNNNNNNSFLSANNNQRP